MGLTSMTWRKTTGYGAGEENRTPDPRITNALLYRLSYTGKVNFGLYAIAAILASSFTQEPPVPA